MQHLVYLNLGLDYLLIKIHISGEKYIHIEFLIFLLLHQIAVLLKLGKFLFLTFIKFLGIVKLLSSKSIYSHKD